MITYNAAVHYAEFCCALFYISYNVKIQNIPKKVKTDTMTGSGSYRFLFIILITLVMQIFIFLHVKNVYADHGIEKTPDDVYALVLRIVPLVNQLRTINNVNKPWPVIPRQKNKAPRHVLQKCFEVLGKIKRLREIKGFGEITMPYYPARNITPNEVYDLVRRMEKELRLVVKEGYGVKPHTGAYKSVNGMSPNDVYRELWTISYAMDPVLGIRGFTPNDVYALSLRILNEVKFLRNSQEDYAKTKTMPVTKGYHPNHVLYTASDFMRTIDLAEHNLWMIPEPPTEVPRRVISFSDAYDSLIGIIAELNRIEYRLGLEKHFPKVKVKGHHDSDDIIQVLKLAMQNMPVFPLNRTLVQYNPLSLVKTPDDVFNAAGHILRELNEYKSNLGIHVKVKQNPPAEGLAPQHVYRKTLECLQQVNQLRIRKGIGETAMPDPPLRLITPNEVYDLVTRLDMELEVIYRKDKFKYIQWYTETNNFTGKKTPGDVYNRMQTISGELDILLGSQGYSPDDVYGLAENINREIRLILTSLDYKIPHLSIPFKPGLKPRDTLAASYRLFSLVKKIQHRAGIFTPFIPAVLPTLNVTPNDVYNELQMIFAEITVLKMHLKIFVSLPDTDRIKFKNKTPSHVEQNIYQSIGFMHVLLGQKTLSGEKNR